MDAVERLEASEWVYVGEGGKHVVFSYAGGSGAAEKWKGRVLRVSKDVLFAALPNDGAANCEIPVDTDVPLWYIRNVVKPLLKAYVDVPELIRLQWEFVAELRDRTLSEGVIPVSRLGQWRNRPESKIIPAPTAQLLWNYRKMNESPCISVEIKPKAGYIAFSPLVSPDHRAKFRKSRFEILQQLHCNGYITKGWDDGKTKLCQSLYNPLHLFSEEPKEVKRAIDNLVATPQNNIRVWIDDHPLMGTDVVDLDYSLYQMIMSQDGYRSDDGPGQASLFDSLTTNITRVLLEEELLRKLLKLQRLDILDVDGAILVYERLCELCGDSADEILDNAFPVLSCSAINEEHILGDSPFQKPLDCPALDALQQEISVFASKLKGSSPPSSDYVDVALERSRSLVKSLTKDACLFLLHNWLLSLVMCDVSFFVMLKPISSYHNVVRQTESSPGIIIAGNSAFMYALKVVDCDKKPAIKLRKRKEKEDTIRFYKEGKTP